MTLTIPQQNHLVSLLRPNNIPEGQKLDENTARTLASRTNDYLDSPDGDPEPTAISKIERLGVGTHAHEAIVRRIPVIVSQDMQAPQNNVNDINYLIAVIETATQECGFQSGESSSSGSSSGNDTDSADDSD